MIQIADIKRTTYTVNGVAFEMVTVEKGSFMMGKTDEIEDRDIRLAYPIDIKTDFEIGEYTVIQALWEAVMGKGNNPSYFKGVNRPVEQVIWMILSSVIKKKVNLKAFFLAV